MKYSSSARGMSLVEQKRQQWAREKEEMSKLNELFASSTTTRQIERTSIRTYYSNVDLSSNFNLDSLPRNDYYSQVYDKQHDQIYERNGYYHHDNECGRDAVRRDSTKNRYNADHYDERVRSPSLPPIGRSKTRSNVPQRVQQSQGTTDEDTSGYFSDSRTSPSVWKSRSERARPRMYLPSEGASKKAYHYGQHDTNSEDSQHFILNQQDDELDKSYMTLAGKMNKHSFANEAENMTRDYSTGVNVQGRKLLSNNGVDESEHEIDFSMPKTPSSTSSDCSRDLSRLSYPNAGFRKEKEERAKWVERDTALAHLYDPSIKSATLKSGPCWLERGFTDSGDESVRSYSFIRGQNVPIDASTLAERATKRMKALELQNAIKEQLEEREKIKRQELEQSLIEQRKHEDRVRQQMEAERLHAEEELRKQQEKVENEQKRQEMMRVAIEKAQQEAELEKRRRKRENLLKLHDFPVEIYHQQQKSEADSPHQRKEPEENKVSDAQFNIHSNNLHTHRSEDDEKILIGTPIKMRKKISSKTKKAVEPENTTTVTSKDSSTATDIDGIALVLQTLPPIVPVLSNDLLNLNQNISNLNNIQLAVMIAHQMQQLNSIAQNQSPEQTNINLQTVNHNSQHPEQKQHSVVSPRSKSPSSADRSTEQRQSNDIKQNESQLYCEHCNIHCKNTANLADKSIKENTCHQVQIDAATLTSDFDDLHTDTRQIDIGTNTYKESTTLDENTQFIDAATQTESKAETECCAKCDHLHVITNELPINELTEAKSTAEKNAVREYVMSTNSSVARPKTNTEQKTDMKELKEPTRLEDRPKWGVNQPIVQYVKASERDPFYLRNKRRRSKKRVAEVPNSSDLHCNVSPSNDSRSVSPSPSIITNSTITLSSPRHKKDNDNQAFKRNICTEILPIKTDVNGRVYLNFREASVIMSEDDIKQNLRNRYKKLDRIMNRCQTSNAILDNFSSKAQKNQMQTERRQSIDIEV